MEGLIIILCHSFCFAHFQFTFWCVRRLQKHLLLVDYSLCKLSSFIYDALEFSRHFINNSIKVYKFIEYNSDSVWKLCPYKCFAKCVANKYGCSTTPDHDTRRWSRVIHNEHRFYPFVILIVETIRWKW